MLILYGITIFAGAFLLFAVQPIVGRMVLPLLGGSPAVWNTAMVFYQAMLLAGYAYAHWATRWLGVRRQMTLHFLVLLVPLVVLPISIPRGWTPPAASNPIPWLLALLTVAVGLPFFVVSATSPLLQRWFSASGRRAAADPYFLYAASNFGSFLALIAYPVLIEPRLRLGDQSWWWAVGYVGLVALTIACVAWVRRTVGDEDGERPAPGDPPADPPTAGRRIRWVLWALVPCSLMLSVTTYLSSEIAPIPLLWVIPLGIYLLTFVLVFAQRRLVPHRWLVRALPVVLVVVLATIVARAMQPIGLLIGLHLAGLFVVAMVCHGELADHRPAARHLTEFYLWLSAGGVLGGMFNALLAPLIFSTVMEYPVTLVLAALLAIRSEKPARLPQRWLDGALPVALGLLTFVLLRELRFVDALTPGLKTTLMYGVPAVLALALWRRPLRFGLGLVAVLTACWLVPDYADRTLHVARSFFGIHRISQDPTGRYHWLSHGNTIHGVQSLDPARRREPLAYFSRSGPLGQAFAAIGAGLKQRVGVIGLGTGSLACYAEPGQQWTFYEIDPVVERIARDRRYFRFLESAPPVEVVIGDARLSLQKAADGQFGVLVLDAYSSDTIPLHLITREALALYRRKLAPDGVLLFHLSNRHLRLERVVAVLARDAGLVCLLQSDPDGDLLATGKTPSKWAVMAGNPASLGSLPADPRWVHPPERLRHPLWTDDYASVFSVFMWR